MKPIYLDYAATTPTDRTALAAAMPYFEKVYFNPSSAHSLGRAAFSAVESARGKVASAIGASPDEVVFTSGGTEAVCLAVGGLDYSAKPRIVVSAIEHDSVAAAAKRLASRGVEVVTVSPTADGIITPDALEAVMTDRTALVCVMTVNNITGAIQPVKELARVAHAHGALFFTDAVQAVCACDINVNASGADLLAASGHKFYAPKGAGFLYIRRGVAPEPMLVGGGQERNMRAGTENVPAIVALGEAIELAVNGREEYISSVGEVEGVFFDNLGSGSIVKVADRMTGLSSVAFEGVSGGRLAVALSLKGVCCSVGSACSAGSATPPPALVAMGQRGDNTLRFSFGRGVTASQAARAAMIIDRTVKRLRAK